MNFEIHNFNYRTCKLPLWCITIYCKLIDVIDCDIGCQTQDPDFRADLGRALDLRARAEPELLRLVVRAFPSPKVEPDSSLSLTIFGIQLQ